MSATTPEILFGTSEKLVFQSVQTMLRHHFKKQGGVVVSKAADCDHFVRRATTEPCDLILLFGQTLAPGAADTGLPIENTLRVIRAIKAHSARPVIALSTMPETEQQLLFAGADVFLAMPYTMKVLTEAVDRCLKRE